MVATMKTMRWQVHYDIYLALLSFAYPDQSYVESHENSSRVRTRTASL